MKNNTLVGLMLACCVLLGACGGNSPDDSSGNAVAAPSDTAVQPLDSSTAISTNSRSTPTDSTVPQVDYLTFAQGVVPLRIGGAGASQGATFEHAVEAIDGNPQVFGFTKAVAVDTDTEFIYALPARTTFTRFAVPNIGETPSPGQTFTKQVEVYGSAAGPDGGWDLLASATLKTHAEKGLVTELPLVTTKPVQWVKLRLVSGIENLRDKMFFEFSEIIGNGTQEVPALVDHFHGIWKGRGVTMELNQDGSTVTGCYDRNATLEGTVSGNVLRATGIAPDDSIRSLFVLTIADDGTMRGVRSTNGAPFRLYTGPTAPEGTTTSCSVIPEPQLGCGSVIHGINFDFDSATIRADSEPVLADLFDGLQSDPEASIVIEGHTSSEGTDAYNQALSERRAQAVVEDLMRRGIDRSRIRAIGKGEDNPIATNDDESGRSLNRRVAVVCS